MVFKELGFVYKDLETIICPDDFSCLSLLLDRVDRQSGSLLSCQCP